METEREAVGFEAVRERTPKLSVLIASYQSGEMLYEALRSVLDQDYRDLEIIVCDDGSDDFEEERLRAFAGARTIKILNHKTNVGTVRNLDEGLRLCTGEWVLILAADDALAGNGVVSELMEQAKRTKKEWLTGSALLCDKELRPMGGISPSKGQMNLLRSENAGRIWSCLCWDCFLPSGGVIYRRDLLERLGGFDKQYRLVEDWPLFLKLVRSGNLPEPLDMPVMLHRASGVSQKAASRSQDYQRDLIETMRREISPHLDMLPTRERREIGALCRDKEAIYRLRFETLGPGAKLIWLLTHMDVVMRRMTREVRRRQCNGKL